MQYLDSVQNLDVSLSSWFPHKFESKDHAIPWFCPKLRYFFKWLGISPSAKPWDIGLRGISPSVKPLEPSALLTLRSVAPNGTLC